MASDAPAVTGVLADLVAERIDQMRQLERRLRTAPESPVLTDVRLIQLASPLLNVLGDVEERVHALSSWLPAAPR